MTSETVVHPRASEVRDQPPAPTADTPVFVDESGRRNRILRALGVVVVGLVALWILAIAASLVGLGSLPGVPTLGGHDDQSRPQSEKAGPAAARPAVVVPRPGSKLVEARARRAAALGTISPRRSPAARSAPVKRRSAVHRSPASTSKPSASNGSGSGQAQGQAILRPAYPGATLHSTPTRSTPTRSMKRAPAATTSPSTSAPGRSNSHKPNL